MFGGAGNDIYFVDNPSEAVTENANEGSDIVLASVDYTIGPNVEAVVLIEGAGNIDAAGNNDNNALIGNSGNNALDGMGGNDYMVGGAGHDIYVADSSGDEVVENAGEGLDIVFASVDHTIAANVEAVVLQGAGDIDAAGNNDNNALIGNAGNNALDGMGGDDYMVGGAGNDIYVADSAGDEVVENASEGNDIVYASADHTLAANVEAVVLQGSGDIDAAGNSDNNALIGNAGNNALDGRGGNDYMVGGGGNDIYVVDDTADATVENSGEGTDSVLASVSHTLAAEVENLLLLEAGGAINGTGNGAANIITGNSFANVINGAGGADGLIGGGGDDTFLIPDTAFASIAGGAGLRPDHAQCARPGVRPHRQRRQDHRCGDHLAHRLLGRNAVACPPPTFQSSTRRGICSM